MKYRLETDKQPEPLVDVRLSHGKFPDGIVLEVRKGHGMWTPILTLTKQTGMLALWDTNRKMLSDMGFDMSSDTNQLNNNGHISVRIA